MSVLSPLTAESDENCSSLSLHPRYFNPTPEHYFGCLLMDYPSPVWCKLDFIVFALCGRGRKCTHALLNHIIPLWYLAICCTGARTRGLWSGLQRALVVYDYGLKKEVYVLKVDTRRCVRREREWREEGKRVA